MRIDVTTRLAVTTRRHARYRGGTGNSAAGERIEGGDGLSAE
jgi:hypothetical protein